VESTILFSHSHRLVEDEELGLDSSDDGQRDLDNDILHSAGFAMDFQL